MVRSNDEAIDQRIVELRRKETAGLFRIHRWLSQWDNFSQLDEQVVLAHILSVLSKNQIPVSRNEVRYCFGQYYQKKYHGDKQSYLTWLYKEFNIRPETRVRKKKAYRGVSDTKRTPPLNENQNNAPELVKSQGVEKNG